MRRALIAKIHIAKKQLEMTENSYRKLLHSHGGNSCTELSTQQLDAVMKTLIQKGFQVRNPKTHGKPKNFSHKSMPKMITKIEALLADMKLPWSYADSIAKQMFGIERMAWVNKEHQLRAVISALSNKQRSAKG